ncbi:MAG: hypothetical protein M0Z66_13475 [Thermaerobacter sp.]|nr:hypothetical protein [Thermaerobacter sp.]
MRRWVATVALLMPLLLVGCGSSHPRTAAPPKRPHPRSVVAISGMQFNVTGVGWLWGSSVTGLSALGVQDPGESAWTPFRTPEAVPNPQRGVVVTPYFLTPRVAWLAWIGSSAAHEVLHTARTEDGGATWSRFESILADPFQNVDSLAFTSRTQGLTLTSTAMSAGQISFALFATSDGGRHWSNTDSSGALAGLHGDAAITLSPSGQDWISGEDVHPILHGTTEVYLATSRNDGPWRRLSLPVPRALARGYYTVSQPPTEHGNQVEVTVDFNASDSTKAYFVSYSSSDGGATWVFGQPVAGSATTSFLTPLQGIALVNHGLYSTADGGSTWHLVAAHVAFQGVATGLHMTTSENGWALFTYDGESGLVRTSDGGRTWHAAL